MLNRVFIYTKKPWCKSWPHCMLAKSILFCNLTGLWVSGLVSTLCFWVWAFSSLFRTSHFRTTHSLLRICPFSEFQSTSLRPTVMPVAQKHLAAWAPCHCDTPTYCNLALPCLRHLYYCRKGVWTGVRNCSICYPPELRCFLFQKFRTYPKSIGITGRKSGCLSYGSVLLVTKIIAIRSGKPTEGWDGAWS